MKCGFTDPDHRRLGDAASRIEAGIVKSRYDVSVCVRRSADLINQPGNRERLVKIPFDAWWAEARIDGDDFRPLGSGSGSGTADFPSHRGCRIRVDDTNLHGVAYLLLEFSTKVEMPDPLIVQHLCRLSCERNPAGRQCVGAMRNPQRHARVLLNQQHADPLISVDCND